MKFMIFYKKKKCSMKYAETYCYTKTKGAISSEAQGSGGAKVMDAILPLQVPVWKRTLDVAISLVCILCIFPFVYLILALFIKIVSPNGPVLFRQQRVGIGGKLFNFLKFRTMHPGDIVPIHDTHIGMLIDLNAPMVKLENHPSIIPLGKILRKTCIDELPQLFNVLRGDMSIVGPRPCIPYEKEKYLRWHHQRFDMLPGMTGLWQVSGKNALTFKQMIRLDIRYSRKMSLWMDMKIILKTPFAILRQVRDAVSKKMAPSAAERFSTDNV